MAGDICERDPNLVDEDGPRDWFPFTDRTQFEVADFLYRRVQMSAGNVDTLMGLWDSSLPSGHAHAPFLTCNEMYRFIDAIPYGKVDWRSFTLTYRSEADMDYPPSWMEDPQIVWYRDPLKVLRSMIGNPAFNGEFDYVPYHKYIDGVHHFQDFMSGDWAWKQAVCIYVFRDLCYTDFWPGHNKRGPRNSWGFFRPDHSWK